MVTDIKQPQPAICHPDRPRYGDQPFCRPCIDSVRFRGEKGRARLRAEIEANQSLSAEVKADVLERVGSIKAYAKKPESEKEFVDTKKSSVRKHVATVAIANSMDFDKVADEIRPGLDPFDKATVSRKLEKDPLLNREIQTQLSERGLSDDDRAYYVRRLWGLFDSNDPRLEAKSIAAMRILGKAFISEKVENVQPQVLPIRGLEEGIARMTGEGLSEAEIAEVELAQSGGSVFDSAAKELGRQSRGDFDA